MAVMVNQEQSTIRPGKKHAAAELAERQDVRAGRVPSTGVDAAFHHPVDAGGGNPRTSGEALRLPRWDFSSAQWSAPESDGPPGS